VALAQHLAVQSPLELHEAAHQEPVAGIEVERERHAALLPLELGRAGLLPVGLPAGLDERPRAVLLVLHEEAHPDVLLAAVARRARADPDRVRVLLGVADVDRRPQVLDGRGLREVRVLGIRDGAAEREGGEDRDRAQEDPGAEDVHADKNSATHDSCDLADRPV
jgi:hypothetical protein